MILPVVANTSCVQFVTQVEETMAGWFHPTEISSNRKRAIRSPRSNEG